MGENPLKYQGGLTLLTSMSAGTSTIPSPISASDYIQTSQESSCQRAKFPVSNHILIQCNKL